MSYTQTDLESIQQAILELATGQRVTEAQIDGQRIKYAEADLPMLKQLRSEIQTALMLDRRLGKQYRLTQSSKGL
ncbi:gpW family head-tail joining protein [Thiomicrorhabdus sp.]|uniref:gpW family head-tail joining protein n=1 Tax=Thiomicrorhabdus sp. TaxID=2039724 RepID=UPI0029C997A5|nr:gpW family head-tail joining protein [Thiomicrorhabdus sp.]